jgi:hypothetical protein
MDPDEKERETKLETYEDRFFKIKAENDRLIYQVKKIEEENYAKSLQLASQRQLIESLQEKVNENKGNKPGPGLKPDENLEMMGKVKDLTSRCLILEQINEETVKKTKKDIEIWQNEAESARRQMRKLEEELFQSKKIAAELEGFEAKYKKELSEKEKLVRSLENLTKTNKISEENAKAFKEEAEKLDKLLRDSNKDEIIQTLNEDLALLKENLTKSSKELEEKISQIQNFTEKNENLEKNSKNLKDLLKKSEEFTENLKKSLNQKDLEIASKTEELIINKKEFFDYFTKNQISLKININLSESIEKPESKLKEIESLQVSSLLTELESFKLQNEKLLKQQSLFESFLESSIKEAIEIYKQKYEELEKKTSEYHKKYKNSKNELQSLQTTLKSYEKTIESQDFSLQQLNQDMMTTKKKLNLLQDDCSSYNSVISQLNQEKNGLENLSKQKESKFKTMAAKLQLLESQIQEKNKELLTKENELINADRQIDLLKKKINSSSSRIKQIASEQIDSQKKKLENYENETKMLKEMLKSVQNELKHKIQELQKLKKPSPRKKEFFDESPIQVVKSKEPEYKFHEVVKDPPYKKQSMNIFQVKSPFRINSRKALLSEEVPSILRHIVKGYLTSYVLCEKEKKEMLKVFIDLDLLRRGVLDKATVISKCEEAMFDTSLLGIYGKEVDYKDFVEMNYHNQLQQVHRDLDINFSQILPGTISISELKLMKQALRPLHRQIWEVIVERIGNEYPKEVDLFIVKQVLSQAQISL